MAFGDGLDEESGLLSEINVTPLVDVMLVLLIVFMLTVPALSHTVTLALPRARSAPAERPPETVDLAVTADGRVHWNGDVVDEAELDARLRALAGHERPPDVLVRGDREVAYERVVRVMAAAQRAGLPKLGFATEPER